MAINMMQGPAGADEMLGSTLPHLLRAKPLSMAALGGGAPKTSPPIEVFRLELGEAVKDDSLPQAKPVGWRYVIDDNGSLAVADVRGGGPGTAAKLSSLTRGALAAGLMKAADAAAASYGQQGTDYEPRILEIPALHTIALWLHGQGNDVFFRFIDSDGRVPKDVVEDPKFLMKLAAAANRKIAKRGSATGAASASPP